jgi:hypothetical protein
MNPMTCQEIVIKKIQFRAQKGLAKYGTTMERTDLTRVKWLRHAQGETLDFAIYLQRLINDELGEEDDEFE